jgi:hypothetical protein
MKNTIVLLLVGGILYFFSRKGTFAKAAQFSFQKMEMNLKKKKIFVYLGVSNPTGQELTINSIVGNLIMNGSQIASIESFDKQKISSSAKSLIKLQLIPSAMGLFEQAKIFVENILKKKTTTTKKTVTASFKGAANLQGLVVPLDVKLMG